MKNEVLVTLVGGEVEMMSAQEYAEVTAPEEGEEELAPCYPSCVGCQMKQYCELMGECLSPQRW